MANITGNRFDNTLKGTRKDDFIKGAAGDDSLYGGKGDDLIKGGSGRDYMYGGKGHDSFLAGPEQDIIYGGEGRDTFLVTAPFTTIGGQVGGTYFDGGDGIDTVDLSQANGYSGGNPYATFINVERFILTSRADALALGSTMAGMTVWAGGGGDGIDNYTRDTTIYGGAGADSIRGLQYRYDDVFYGGSGDDRLFGGQGDDKLYGGKGRDLMEGGLGKDLLKGGAGADEFTFQGSLGASQVGTEKVWTGKGSDLIRIEDNYAEAAKLVIYDFGKNDSMLFNDLTFGDNRDMPDNFREFKEAAKNTKKGLVIEYNTDQVMVLKGLEKSDLDPEQFDFFQA